MLRTSRPPKLQPSSSSGTRSAGFILAGMVLAGTSLGGCSASTGPEDPDIVFPLDPGNTWTYAPGDPQFGDPLEWEVTGRMADTVTLDRPVGGSHPGPVTLIDKGDVIQIVLEGGETRPFYRFRPGASWSHHDLWDCDDESGWIAVKEANPIVTPAGTFDNTIRLERRTGATCADAGTMFEWWAPGVGLVRWEELNFYAGGPLGFELIAYAQSFLGGS